ncbi:phage major capsid protein [Streptococcus pneumoniae]|nr:phage major capsid protein [Streptococcus pneumoniae]MDS8591568.1 phage major capsid protein [Streptococcus pneumoniae]
MKTLVELMEERQKYADELSEIKLKKASIEEKLKSATIGEEELAQLKSDAEELVPKAEELKKTISKLDVEIEEKEDNLNKAAKSIKEVQKGKTQMEYLKTKESALDFARILMDNEGSSNSARKAWEANLVEKGVTDINKILPEPVLIAIQNAFNDYDGILNHVTKDPRYAVRVALQTKQAKAKGHQNGKTKKDESFVFIDYTINSAAVYIKYSFEYADLKKDTTGAYFNYVMNELAQGFIRAVERAVVIGDGKNSDDDDKITEIKSIAEETLVQLFDTQEISVDGEFDSTVLETLVKGIDKLAANTTPILVTSKTIARKLKMVKDGEKRYIDPQPFAPISQTGNVIAGYQVYVYDWMEDATNPIIAFADKAYKMIGDDVSADRFEDYDVTMNRRHIELASVLGGRLGQYKSAVKFTKG